jgi:hypothetical protein
MERAPGGATSSGRGAVAEEVHPIRRIIARLGRCDSDSGGGISSHRGWAVPDNQKVAMAAHPNEHSRSLGGTATSPRCQESTLADGEERADPRAEVRSAHLLLRSPRPPKALRSMARTERPGTQQVVAERGPLPRQKDGGSGSRGTYAWCTSTATTWTSAGVGGFAGYWRRIRRGHSTTSPKSSTARRRCPCPPARSRGRRRSFGMCTSLCLSLNTRHRATTLIDAGTSTR